MARIFIANIPVWHGGLFSHFQNLSIKDRVIVIGGEIARGIGGEFQDERRLPDTECVRMVKVHLWHRVELLTLRNIEKPRIDGQAEILATNDEVTRNVVERAFPGVKVVWLPLFSSSGLNIRRPTSSYDEESNLEVDQKWMRIAEEEAKKSPLQDLMSGAVLVSGDGNFIGKAGIRHLPTEWEPFLGKDHRLSIIHPAVTLTSLGSRNGRPLLGGTLYSTDFPCIGCAKDISLAGIKRLVVKEGEKPRSAEILRGYGVRIVRLTPSEAAND